MKIETINEELLKLCTNGLVTLDEIEIQLKDVPQTKIIESLEYLLNEGKIIDIEFKEENELITKYSNFHDYIIKEPELVMIVKKEDTLNDLMLDKNNQLIMSLLRIKPMTIKDLTRQFKVNGLKKSEKTIWHYVNNFTSKNLVIEVGQRIVKGRSSNEKLFQSSHYIYYNDYDPIKGLEEIQGKKIAQTIRELISIFYKDRKLEKEGTMLNLLKNIEKQQHAIIIELFNRLDKPTAMKFSALSNDEVRYIHHIIGWLIWLADQELSNPEISKLRIH